MENLNEEKNHGERGVLFHYEGIHDLQDCSRSVFSHRPLATRSKTVDHHWFSLLAKSPDYSLRYKWMNEWRNESPPFLFRHRVFTGCGLEIGQFWKGSYRKTNWVVTTIRVSRKSLLSQAFIQLYWVCAYEILEIRFLYADVLKAEVRPDCCNS